MKRGLLILLLLAAAPLSAVTRYVALVGGHVAPFTNWANAATDIQAAIDLAQDGDTILVTDGVYTISAPLAITNVQLTMASVNGAAATIVDAAAACRVCLARQDTVLDGFTFTRGALDADDAGAGVSVAGGIIRNCVVSDCDARYGGGLLIGGDGLAQNCVIISNNASRAGGGIIIAESGRVEDCLVLDNSASDDGAVEDLYLGGGGVLLFQGGLLLRTTVSNNMAGSRGGGITIAGTGVVDRCLVAGNAAPRGGGVYCHVGGYLQSSLVLHNGADEGGGIYVFTNARVHNCTIAGNVATNGGGVLHAYGGTNLNSIIYFNTAATNPNYAVYGSGHLLYTCTTPAVSNLFDGRGCITANPVFVNYGLGNLQLSNSSPCIDAGTNVPGLRLLMDYGGNARVSNVVEMGAHERGYPAPTLAITTTIASVTYNVAALALAGTNAPTLAGRVWLRNAANNATVSVAPTGTSWLAPALPLAVGSNVIAVFGTNTDGYIATDPRTILRGDIGSGAPFVDITNKDMNVVFDTTSFFVAGTNNIHVTGEQWLTNTANGYFQRFFATSQRWFSVAAPLAMGTNIIWVFGTNLYGALTNDSITLVRLGATGVPFIAITSAAAAVTYDITALSVAGTNNAQVAGWMWLTNTMGAAVSFAAADAWVAPPIPLVVGTNTLVVLGTNLVNQTASATLAVTRGAPGTGQPFIDCTNANITMANTVTNFACAGTNNANVVGAMRVRNLVTLEEHYFSAAPVWVAPAVALVPGLNDIEISGVNTYGTPSYDLVLVTRQGVATGPPFVDVLSSNSTGTYDMTTAVVRGTNNANVVAAMWLSNAVTHTVTYFSSQLQWTSSPIALVVGPNLLWVVGQNAAGTQAMDSVTITRGVPGTGLPQPEITNGDLYVTYDIASYALSGTNNANVLPGGTMWVSNLANNASATFTAAPAWTAPPLALEVGLNMLIVVATNSAGIVGADATLVMREPPGSGLPFVKFTTPATTVLPEVDTIQLSGSNNANVIGLLAVSNVQTGSSIALAATPTWTTPAMPLAMGWNDFIAWGTNIASAATSDTVRITRGNPGDGAPIITLITTNAVMTFDAATLALRGTINFNVIGRMWASNAANGAVASFNATQYWSSAALPLMVGTNTLTVYGTNYLNAVTNATVSIVRGIPGTGLPHIFITSTVFVVAHDVSTYVVAGTNNPNVVGTMWVSNDTQVTVASFPADAAWSTPPVPLDRHINILSVFGTNLHGQLSLAQIVVDRPVPAGVTNYVADSGANLWPYITWATAATNILDAVNEAVGGNVVLVAPGTNRIANPVRINCDILVQSVAGATATVILAANPQARAVQMQCGVLDGFMIAPDGAGASQVDTGAGIWMQGPGLVRNCVIAGFHATAQGGGIYCDGGGISNCTILENQAGWAGGGVCLDDAAQLRDSIVAGNRAIKGGGVYVSDGLVSNCLVYANAAMPTGTTQVAAPTLAQVRDSSDYGGGGITLDNGGQVMHTLLNWNRAWNGAAVHLLSDGLVFDCQITHNTSVYYAAVYCQYGGTIDRSTLSDNIALSGAGLMLNYGGSARNCVIARNRANDAAGVYAVGPSTLENCTICANTANDSGGGLAAGWGTLVRNAIVYFNNAPASSNIALLNGDVTIEHSCSTPLPAGADNICSNPALSDVSAGCFYPTAGSPCINAGANQPWMAAANDLAGRARIMLDIVDIGAYEFTNGPLLWATPVEVDFGPVVLGDSVIATVMVANAGTELLSGTVQNVSAPFAAIAGVNYALTPGAQHQVVLGFTPPDLRRYVDSARLTGGDGVTLILFGEGIPEPALAGLLLLAVLCRAARR